VTAAERQRRRRARLAGRLLSVRLDLVPEEHLDSLVELGLIGDWDRDDPAAVAEAILRLLAGQVALIDPSSRA
jgi:hypothetical protein